MNIRVLYAWVIRSIEALSMIGISLIVLFTSYEVAVREILGKPTIWTNEITSYLLVWFGMLGIAYAYEKGTHVSVDLIFRMLPPNWQKLVNLLTLLFMLCFSLLIAIYGYKYWYLAYSRDWRHFGMLDIPMSYTRIALPLVGGFMVIQFALTIWDQYGAHSRISRHRRPTSNT